MRVEMAILDQSEPHWRDRVKEELGIPHGETTTTRLHNDQVYREKSKKRKADPAFKKRKQLQKRRLKEANHSRRAASYIPETQVFTTELLTDRVGIEGDTL